MAKATEKHHLTMVRLTRLFVVVLALHILFAGFVIQSVSIEQESVSEPDDSSSKPDIWDVSEVNGGIEPKEPQEDTVSQIGETPKPVQTNSSADWGIYPIYGPLSIGQTLLSFQESTWYGIGEDYKLTMAYDSSGNPDFLNDWRSLLNDQRFDQWNFNVIRLDFHFSDLGANPYFADDVDLDYEEFATVVRLLADYGYGVVVTDHSWAGFGSSTWMDDWTNFVVWLNQPAQLDVRNAIAAYSLRSECGNWTYEQGPWWNGLYMPNRNSPPSGWNWWDMVTSAYAELSDRIRTIQPGSLVVWADPYAYYQSTVRLQDRRDGVVYAWHVWTNDAEDKGHTEPILMANWAAWPWMNKTDYPNSINWVGEFGSWYETGTMEGICTYAGQKRTYTDGAMSLMQWCVNNNVGFSMQYWENWNKQDEYSDWLQTINFVGPR